MSWKTKLNAVAKSGASTAINALTAAACFGNTAGDAAFTAHLSAAQAAAIAAVAGLTGNAANFDVAITCATDSGPGRAHDAGASITIAVVERH